MPAAATPTLPLAAVVAAVAAAAAAAASSSAVAAAQAPATGATAAPFATVPAAPVAIPEPAALAVVANAAATAARDDAALIWFSISRRSVSSVSVGSGATQGVRNCVTMKAPPCNTWAVNGHNNHGRAGYFLTVLLVRDEEKLGSRNLQRRRREREGIMRQTVRRGPTPPATTKRKLRPLGTQESTAPQDELDLPA